MVKIQINLSDEEDMIVGVYKTTNKLVTKEQAIKKMIQFFDVSIRPKNSIIDWLNSEHQGNRGVKVLGAHSKRLNSRKRHP